MLILGIDPGTATTGFGFIKVHKLLTEGEKLNGHFEALDFGLIETSKETTPGSRLQRIHAELDSLLSAHKPDIMVIERIFFATNVKTAIRVGQAQGVMLMAAAKNNITTVEYAPGTIKKLVTGNGRADKKEIQRSLRTILGARVRSRPMKKTHFDNAADALAVALCHAYQLTQL